MRLFVHYKNLNYRKNGRKYAFKWSSLYSLLFLENFVALDFFNF
jgi:hypothetical protein